MEVPEKIWITVCGKDLSYEWHSDSEFEAKDYNDIEYTRTDAFIEKAVKYVANHFLAPGMDNEINDFVNYMKGE